VSSDSKAPPRVQVTGSGEGAVLTLSGDWTQAALPALAPDALVPIVSSRLPIDASGLFAWDSRLSAYLLRLHRELAARDSVLEFQGLPEALRSLMTMATAVPRRAAEDETKRSWLSRDNLHDLLADIGGGFLDSLAFLGDTLRGLGRTLTGRGAMRRGDLLDACYRSGPDALPIITLTSLLVGMILAYLGAEQLRQFGAAIYVADLVAIGMLREMGALMTAVVMSGRTGAAYAAELSSMQGNEEIDAISTLGIPPMEFLVVPRVLALCLTMPLLVIFADALGIVGGALVAGGMGVTPLQYLSQLEGSIAPSHFLVGLFKALLFALLIAVAGCRAGMQAGRSSEAVGKATTDAVVTAVVYLIVADAGVNILCQQLGI
jgi:phospholipid/cholesterol/gamma-HCH transport system permease protein